MLGLLWEWCADSDGSRRVLRGGSWKSRADDCTATSRRLDKPDARDPTYGFRVVKDPE